MIIMVDCGRQSFCVDTDNATEIQIQKLKNAKKLRSEGKPVKILKLDSFPQWWIDLTNEWNELISKLITK